MFCTYKGINIQSLPSINISISFSVLLVINYNGEVINLMMMTTVMMSRIFAFSTKHRTKHFISKYNIYFILLYSIQYHIFFYIVTIIMVYMSNSDSSRHIQGKKISSVLWKLQKKKDENIDSFSNWIWFSRSIKPHPGCDWLKTPQLIKSTWGSDSSLQMLSLYYGLSLGRQC